METFSENMAVMFVSVVTLSEKVAGSVFECSRVQVEAEWLASVSVRAVPGNSVRLVFMPVFWMSVSEVLSKFSGNLVKLGVDMADLANHSLWVTVTLLFFVVCAICLQVFMIQGILTIVNKKK